MEEDTFGSYLPNETFRRIISLRISEQGETDRSIIRSFDINKEILEEVLPKKERDKCRIINLQKSPYYQDENTGFRRICDDLKISTKDYNRYSREISRDGKISPRRSELLNSSKLSTSFKVVERAPECRDYCVRIVVPLVFLMAHNLDIVTDILFLVLANVPREFKLLMFWYFFYPNLFIMY